MSSVSTDFVPSARIDPPHSEISGWTEEDYLGRHFEGLVELVEGTLEILPMVTPYQQDVQVFLDHKLWETLKNGHPGRIYLAPLRLKTSARGYREPDILLVRPEHIPDKRAPALGADLVIEVVSGTASDSERDDRDKRIDYALARVPEYWIVDPDQKTILVLALDSERGQSVIHGEFPSGTIATSTAISELKVDVDACFSVV